MRHETIIEALANKGYEVANREITKNGVIFHGIEFNTGSNTRPVVYTDKIIEEAEKNGFDYEWACDRVLSAFNSANVPVFNVSEFKSKEWVSERIAICLQRESTQSIVKKPTDFAGIEQYLRVFITGDQSFIVKPEYLNEIGMSEEEAWVFAKKNTLANVKIQSVVEALCESQEMPYSEEMDNAIPMIVVKSSRFSLGSAGVLFHEVLESVAKRLHVNKLFVIPSSIYECIVIANDGGMSIDDVTEMVGIVNCAEVSPEDQLGDTAYEYDV